MKPDNPEVVRAREPHVPVVPRAMMLAELMRFKQGIAIAGTHGKTTTTSLVSAVLGEAGLDPTCVIGGRLNSIGTNARLGKGEFLVAEADESDASFLYLQPVISVVTNIDADHMETYGQDFERLKSTFVEFLGHLPFYGLAVLCKDDPHVRAIMPRSRARCSPTASARTPTCAPRTCAGTTGRMRFTAVSHANHFKPLDVMLNLPGEHYVLNALAVIAVAREVGAPEAAIAEGLAEFTGVGRRFQRYGDIPTRRRRQLHARGRLRPPPGGDGGDARRGARRLPGPPRRARLPAAPLHAHARPLRGLRARALDRRRAGARRRVSRGRGADRGRRRPLARARRARGGQGRAGVRGEVARRCARRCSRACATATWWSTMGAGSIGAPRAGAGGAAARHGSERAELTMDMSDSASLAGLRGELRHDEPMARHVSWRAGGRARAFYQPASVADLCAFLRTRRRDEPILFVGLGSNLLVRDGGFDGTVIFTHHALTGIAPGGAGTRPTFTRRRGRSRAAPRALRRQARRRGRRMDGGRAGHDRRRARDERGLLRRRDLEPRDRGRDRGPQRQPARARPGRLRDRLPARRR